MVAPRASFKPSMQWTDKDGRLTDDAFRALRAIGNVSPMTPEPQTLAASPFTYQATRDGMIVVNGGTVSSVLIARNGVSVTMPTNGGFPMRQNDVITIAFTVAPTVTFL